MDVHFLFQLAERAIQRVGGVWDMKVGILLVGKQVRQVRCERAVGRLEPAVRVLPAALGVRCKATFAQE